MQLQPAAIGIQTLNRLKDEEKDTTPPVAEVCFFARISCLIYGLFRDLWTLVSSSSSSRLEGVGKKRYICTGKLNIRPRECGFVLWLLWLGLLLKEEKRKGRNKKRWMVGVRRGDWRRVEGRGSPSLSLSFSLSPLPPPRRDRQLMCYQPAGRTIGVTRCCFLVEMMFGLW